MTPCNVKKVVIANIAQIVAWVASLQYKHSALASAYRNKNFIC